MYNIIIILVDTLYYVLCDYYICASCNYSSTLAAYLSIMDTALLFYSVFNWPLCIIEVNNQLIQHNYVSVLC